MNIWVQRSNHFQRILAFTRTLPQLLHWHYYKHAIFNSMCNPKWQQYDLFKDRWWHCFLEQFLILATLHHFRYIRSLIQNQTFLSDYMYYSRQKTYLRTVYIPYILYTNGKYFTEFLPLILYLQFYSAPPTNTQAPPSNHSFAQLLPLPLKPCPLTIVSPSSSHSHCLDDPERLDQMSHALAQYTEKKGAPMYIKVKTCK